LFPIYRLYYVDFVEFNLILIDLEYKHRYVINFLQTAIYNRQKIILWISGTLKQSSRVGFESCQRKRPNCK